MTQATVERLVKKWQAKLGLDHWEIGIDWDAQCDQEAFMSITRMKSYDRATIEVSPDWGKWSDAETEQRVVHELLHLVLREIDTIVFDHLDGHLSPAEHDIINSAYRHHSEGVVDRLATVLAREQRPESN